jgi:hypothetical protein
MAGSPTSTKACVYHQPSLPNATVVKDTRGINVQSSVYQTLIPNVQKTPGK